MLTFARAAVMSSTLCCKANPGQIGRKITGRRRRHPVAGEDMADRLHVKAGDEVFAVETEAIVHVADRRLDEDGLSTWIRSSMRPLEA